DDVRAAKAASSKGVLGAIAGRALYDGSLDLKEALAV
ncbi:MAG: 1-(5-phosphoribosyl)-5-((5-phosphoribosylamino)methylideneamino)imidazole-4-carboxamide isomerase, partial [Thalassospira sp.]|nr:1-(5-phosphoribosyl)-5-((5-phosphoribosylamino)methylideneamino)imidazole-4-carboxamide isomerase [Thalassospira sp.]